MTFEINEEVAVIEVRKATSDSFIFRVILGPPEFETRKIPMKAAGKYHINQPIVIEGRKFPVTSLSVGNPHTVMFVDNFDFDWRELGRIIEQSQILPHRTNVEFAKIVNRRKIILNDWERGAGATGSSGTGAAAAVVAGVVNGLVDRQAEVVFPTGSLHIDWSEGDDNIILTGPAEYVCEGVFNYHPGK
jgi:diaminopimelate epimerase